MSEETSEPLVIPETLDELFGFSAACACGRVHSVELKGASIRSGAVEDVLDWAREIGHGLRVCVVVDSRTDRICGRQVRDLLARDGYRVEQCVLPDGAGGRPHADDGAVTLAEEALAACDLAVAVGSGTINDVTKLSSYRRKIPYLAVATAPSMNGYTSAIAAVMSKGVKRTVECHQPLAVIADLDILCRAPGDLVAAGLGDLESKPTASADFRLAGFVRGDYYCPAPEKVVLNAEARVAEAAAAIGKLEPEAIALLTEALLLSGISMKLAGTSSPASGGEHLISHFWDMTAPDEDRVEGWHGAQVGVATIVTASLYESLRELDPAGLDVERLVAAQTPKETLLERVGERHGRRAGEVAREFSKKLLDADELRDELGRIIGGWDEPWAELQKTLRPSSEVRAILSAAGAPVSMKELGLTPGHLQRAYPAAREIRGRFTVLDLAAELGVLDSLSAEVLDRSACLA